MAEATRPLSSHPAFGLLIALWFAALLGFGTWVMPGAVFDRAAAASGLADAVPALAPPIGSGTRIAISIAAGLLGLALGLFIARRAGGRADRLEDDSFADGEADDDAPFDEPARRPLQVREDLGGHFDDAAEPHPAIPASEAEHAASEPAHADEAAFDDRADAADGVAAAEEPAAEPDAIPAPAPPQGEVEEDDDLARFASVERETRAWPAHEAPEPAAPPTESPADETIPIAEEAASLSLADLRLRLERALEDYRGGRSAGAGEGVVTYLRAPPDEGETPR